MSLGSYIRSLSFIKKLLLGAYIFYLIFAFGVSAHFSHSAGDFASNFEITQSLQAGKGFGRSYVAPTYPLVLLILNSVGLVSTYGLRMFQIVLLLIGIFLTYRLAQLVFQRELVARIAAGMIAFWPIYILQIFSHNTDLVYIIVSLCGFYFFFDSWFKKNIFLGFISGVLFVIAALADPIGVYVPLLIALWYGGYSLFVYLKQGTMSYSWKAGVIMFVCFVCVISLWTYRNIKIFGSFSNSPIVEKQIEREVFTNPERLQTALSLLNPHSIHVIGIGIANTLLIPYRIDSIDQNTSISYKRLMHDIVTLHMAEVSVNTFLILAVKLVVTLMHLGLLIAACMGLWYAPKKYSGIYILLVLYVLTAIIIYGGHELYMNLSPTNGFFFELLPLTVIFSAYGIEKIYEKQ